MADKQKLFQRICVNPVRHAVSYAVMYQPNRLEVFLSSMEAMSSQNNAYLQQLHRESQEGVRVVLNQTTFPINLVKW